MTTTTTEAKILIEAYDTLRAIEGFAIREVFTGGLAAVDNGDRPAVDKSIARLNAWSENAVYGARIKCRAGGLQDAATYARAARTVWAYYVHHQPS